ncbi:hypothetical protein ACFL6I_27915 [candidate division KSB1 bacterium]
MIPKFRDWNDPAGRGCARAFPIPLGGMGTSRKMTGFPTKDLGNDRWLRTSEMMALRKGWLSPQAIPKFRDGLIFQYGNKKPGAC